MHVTPTETALVRIFDLEDPVRMLQSVLGIVFYICASPSLIFSRGLGAAGPLPYPPGTGRASFAHHLGRRD